MNLLTSRTTAFLLGGVVAASLIAGWWSGCRHGAGRPEGKVLLAEPVQQYEPQYVYELPAPPADRLKRTGAVVEVPTFEPSTEEQRLDMEKAYGDLEQLGPLVGEFVLGDLPYGGRLLLDVPRTRHTEPGQAKVPPIRGTLRPNPRPWAEWETQWWVGGGYEVVGDGARGLVGEVRWVPGRVWSVNPELSSGWSEQRGWYGRGMVGMSF